MFNTHLPWVCCSIARAALPTDTSKFIRAASSTKAQPSSFATLMKEWNVFFLFFLPFSNPNNHQRCAEHLLQLHKKHRLCNRNNLQMVQCRVQNTGKNFRERTSASRTILILGGRGRVSSTPSVRIEIRRAAENIIRNSDYQIFSHSFLRETERIELHEGKIQNATLTF